MEDQKDSTPAVRPGSQEEIILRLVMHERGEGYGRSIRDGYQEATGKGPALTTVYTVLERLETKGFVTSRWTEPVATRGGRRKQLWSITGDGIKALLNVEQAQEKLRQAFPVPGLNPAKGGS